MEELRVLRPPRVSLEKKIHNPELIKFGGDTSEPRRKTIFDESVGRFINAYGFYLCNAGI